MENQDKNLELGNEQGQENGNQAEEKLTFTQEELDALIQKHADQRVSQALKTAERKNAQKLKEAERLAQMSATEKYEYELQQREQAIAEKERSLAIAENKAEASRILADKGISVSLVDFVVAEDAETMNENIKLLETEFKKSVKAEVERRLATGTPKKNLPLNQEITKDSFHKMSYTDRVKLATENPDLYQQMIGG